MGMENMILTALELAHRVCIRKGVQTDRTLLGLPQQHPRERHPCHDTHQACIPGCGGCCNAATFCVIEIDIAEEYQEHNIENEKDQEDYHKQKHSHEQAPETILHLRFNMVLKVLLVTSPRFINVNASGHTPI